MDVELELAGDDQCESADCALNALQVCGATPQKMNGWNRKNHPIEKGSHLPNFHFGGSMSIVQGFLFQIV